MLETTDILVLEKRWKKYKTKVLIKKLSIYFFIILIAFIGGFSFLNYDIKLFLEKNITSINKKNEPLDIKDKEVNLQNLNKIKTNDINKNQQTLILQPVNNNLHVKKDSQIQIEQEVSNLETKEEVLPPSEIKEVKNIFPQEEVIEIESVAKKPKISIKTNEVETTTYLKDKYYSTHNIIFALMLAEEYLHQKDYKESLKWSLKANEIDPQNERSWIIFAKAKARNGNPKQAIKALEAFQRTHPSSQISALVEKLKHGNYK